MNKIKNWILPAFLAVAGSADLFLGLLNDFVKEAGLPAYYTTAFRIGALLLTVIVLKKQPPSIKKARQAKNTQ